MGRHTGFAPEPRENPVFASLSGKRGLAVLALLLLAVIDVLLGLERSQQLATALPETPVYNASVDYPRQIADQMAACAQRHGEIEQISQLGIAIIGDGGVFQRVVEIRHAGDTAYAVDPFTNRVVLSSLTPLEAHNTADCRYAIQQFGTVPEKTIILTFDDGPSSIWTPRMLAVLAAYHVHATFFEIGDNILAAPNVFRQVVASGNVVGNHTLTHPLIIAQSPPAARQQFVAVQQIMATLDDYESSLCRTPFGGGNLYGPDSIRSNAYATLVAQQLGLTEVGFTADTSDFTYPPYGYIPTPAMGGPGSPGLAVVMHDAGGKDNQAAYSLLIRVIEKAKALGYHFMTMAQLLQMQGGSQPVISRARPSIEDRGGYLATWIGDALPNTILPDVLTVCTWVVLAFAVLWMIRAHLGGVRQHRPIPEWHPGRITVGIAALNEEKVIERTVRAIFRHSYSFEVLVLVINDGSTDGTRQILDRLALEFNAYPRKLKAVHLTTNVTKGPALDLLFRHHAEGEVTVTVDSDTVPCSADDIPRLVRHFRDPQVGAVAGYIMASNQPTSLWRGLLLAFQVAEYNLGIAVLRVAQGKHGIMIVPGAFSAWRNSVMRRVGMTADTAGEDADAGLGVRKAGYLVKLDITARAITECPCTLRGVAKQWTRWTFGTVQNFVKHRDIMVRPGRYGLLSWVMWYSVLSFAIPLVLLPVSYGVTIAAAYYGNWSKLLVYFAIFTSFRLAQNLTAMVVLREWSWRTLSTAVFYRFINDPLQIYLAWRTLFAVATGRLIGWKGTRAQRVGTGDGPTGDPAKGMPEPAQLNP